jgi:hypothetical protein
MLHSCRQIQKYIVAAVVLPLFISYYFTQSHFRNLTEICIRKGDNTADYLTQKPRAENPSTSHPNPTSTDSADLTDKTLKCVILLAADCLNLLLVFPEDEDTHAHTHEVSALIYCCVCDLNTSMETWMEVATYSNRSHCVCDTLRIVRHWFVQHSTFTLALRLHRSKSTAEASYRADF